MATTQAVKTFSFYMRQPGGDIVASDLYSKRLSNYALGWSAYKNSLFDAENIGILETEARRLGVSINMAGLDNITGLVVDFYAHQVYPGVLTPDGLPPKHGRLAIPLKTDNDAFREAVAQAWQWGNWQQSMRLWVRFGAAMGDTVAEVVDDTTSGRVFPVVVPPSQITDIEFGVAPGSIESYTREYRTYDRESDQYFNYKRVVTRTRITEYRDDKVTSEGANPYGFCAAVLVRHTDDGSLPGSPAIRHWSTVLRLNSLMSRVYKHIEIQCKSPLFISGSGTISPVVIQGPAAADTVNMFKIDGSAEFHQVLGNLDLKAAGVEIERLCKVVERNHPEATAYRAMRDMTTLSGRAIEKITGDVEGYLLSAQTNYDAALVRLHGMLVSIGGFRLAERAEGWAAPNNQQLKFAPFGLDSYRKGDLDHSIDQRPLLMQDPGELADEQAKQWGAVKAAQDAGVTLDLALREVLGWDDKQIKDALDKFQAEQVRQIRMQQSDTIPTIRGGTVAKGIAAAAGVQ